MLLFFMMMTRFRYLVRELEFRRGRSLATSASIGLSVLAAVLLTALATSSSRAIQLPMKTVGADVVVQLTGDIPPKLEGLVFPHPNALLPRTAIERIRYLPGVLSVTRAVYLWELAPDHYQSLLGVEEGEAGIGGLNARLIDGRPLAPLDRSVLVDSDFAARKGIKPGFDLPVGDTMFPVAGIVDAARAGKVARADVYLPLAVAQALAAAAPQVRALYLFGPNDANLLLVKVERRELEAVVAQIGKLLGKKGILSSELSFRKTLENVLFLSDTTGWILVSVIGAFTIAIVLRATVTAVNERRRDTAVLRAVGWPWHRVRQQIILENALLALAGTVVGLALAVATARIVGGIDITIEFPWDLSSTPHFLPEATLDRRQTITAPLELSWRLMTAIGSGGVLAGVVAAWAALFPAPPNPWPLLRGE